MEDNELYFSEEEIDDLSVFLFANINQTKNNSIGFNEFFNHLLKYPGLIENLCINVENMFLPKPKEIKNFQVKKLVPQCMKWSHIRNNYVNVAFFLTFLAINIVLFVTRAIDFYDPINPNHFYMIARASGTKKILKLILHNVAQEFRFKYYSYFIIMFSAVSIFR